MQMKMEIGHEEIPFFRRFTSVSPTSHPHVFRMSHSLAGTFRFSKLEFSPKGSFIFRDVRPVVHFPGALRMCNFILVQK